LGLPEYDFYTVKFNILDSNQVRVVYKGLVISSKSGTVNLKEDNRGGELNLQVGQSVRLGTPTMDIGTSVTITLTKIK